MSQVCVITQCLFLNIHSDQRHWGWSFHIKVAVNLRGSLGFLEKSAKLSVGWLVFGIEFKGEKMDCTEF